MYLNSKIETIRYRNGLKSILISNKYSFVATIIIFVMVGSVNEKPFQTGLSHFLEHIMFKGSKNYPGDLMSRRVENMGGCVNAVTSKEFTAYYINVQKCGVTESIRMLADTMQNPLFIQSEIDREKNVVVEEINRHFDDPMAAIYEKYYKAIYATSVLRNSIIGTSNVVLNTSRMEMCNYHKVHYVPEKMVVVVSGDFDEDSAMKAIDETFGKFRKRARASLKGLSFAEKTLKGNNVVECGNVELGYMLLGFIGPGAIENDVYTAELAANILGGYKSSRLYKTLYRERHLTYSIESSFVIESGSGNVCVMSVFDSKNVEEVREEIVKQIENVANNFIAEDELNIAKILMQANWSFSLETSFDIAYNYGYWHLVGNPAFMVEYIKRVESLTAHDIKNFFERYYSREKISSVTLLPKLVSSRQEKT
jgi:zinc protease